MKVLVEFTLYGLSNVRELQNVDFMPRKGEKIGLPNIQGYLEVQEVIHHFAPENMDQLVRITCNPISE